jgi:hypothetical protein
MIDLGRTESATPPLDPLPTAKHRSRREAHRGGNKRSLDNPSRRRVEAHSDANQEEPVRSVEMMREEMHNCVTR